MRIYSYISDWSRCPESPNGDANSFAQQQLKSLSRMWCGDMDSFAFQRLEPLLKKKMSCRKFFMKRS